MLKGGVLPSIHYYKGMCFDAIGIGCQRGIGIINSKFQIIALSLDWRGDLFAFNTLSK